MTSPVDRAELIELLSHYADIADLKEFTELPHHAITGHVVEVHGDSATVHAHVRADHWLPGELPGDRARHWLVAGFYDNEAVRTPDGWRLTSVKLTATHQENTPTPAPEQAR